MTAYGKRTLDFVERLRRLTGYDAISREIRTSLEWFGLTHVTAWSMPVPGRSPDDCVLLNSRPADYLAHYARNNHVLRDPVVTEIRRTPGPFSWRDVRARRNLSRAEIAIMDEARDFDADDGLMVPIFTPSGSVMMFSPCGRQPDLSPPARAAVEIIGICSFQALDRAREEQTEGTAPAPLTPREREIMRWVAAGRSDDDIAAILSITTRTVTWHVENAKRKLDAFRRPHAVFQALRLGEITL